MVACNSSAGKVIDDNDRYNIKLLVLLLYNIYSI